MRVLWQCAIGHPVEFLKIQKQTSPANASYLSLARALTQQKGLLGLWDGFVPWGLVQAATKGAVFGGAQVVARKALAPLERSGHASPRLTNIIAGGIAGGVQGFAL